MTSKAIFLDRDGTINEDLGYIYEKEDLVFIKDSLKALKILQKYFNLYIITNQSGIGKNIFTEDDFFKFNDYFLETLKKAGITIKKVYYCKHKNEDNCICKKPSTYFIDKIIKEDNILRDLSYVVGDHPHDVVMGIKAGIKSIYLLSGHGKKHLNELDCTPEYIAVNLYEATKFILKNQ
mgnify:CR=1 FL=1